MEAKGTFGKSSHFRRIRRHMGATLSLYEFTIDQPDTGMRPDSGHSQCTVGLPCINKSSYFFPFVPKELAYIGPQNYLAYACCMKPGCSEMIQSMSPHRAARNTSLLYHSLLTILIIILIPCLLVLFSLDVLRISLWCRLVSLMPRPVRGGSGHETTGLYAKFCQVKFCVKIQIWDESAIFFS